MQRVLGMVTLFVVGGLVVAILMALGTLPHLSLPSLTGRTGRGWLGIEPASFLVGFLSAVLLGWLWQLPWGRLAEALGDLFRAWRRNAALLAMAAVFTGILLFY